MREALCHLFLIWASQSFVKPCDMFSDSLQSSELREFSQNLCINSLLNFHYFTIIGFIPWFLLIIYFTLLGNLSPSIVIYFLVFVFLLSSFRISKKGGLKSWVGREVCSRGIFPYYFTKNEKTSVAHVKGWRSCWWRLWGNKTFLTPKPSLSTMAVVFLENLYSKGSDSPGFFFSVCLFEQTHFWYCHNRWRE